MSIRTRLIPVVSAFCLLVASPAYAWFGEGWLEMLSGPGPFKGLVVDFHLVCLAAPGPLGSTGIQSGQGSPPGWAVTFPKDPTGRAWFAPLGCNFLDRDKPRLQFGLQYANMSASNNPLDYSQRPGVAAAAQDVDLNMFMLTADTRINRVVDLGVAVGKASFSSPEGVFEDLSKTVFQPLRVTVRPLSVLTNQSRLSEVLVVRVDATKFNGGFTGEEFGARPGSFRESGELVWGWLALVDLGALFWR